MEWGKAKSHFTKMRPRLSLGTGSTERCAGSVPGSGPTVWNSNAG